MRRCGQIVFVCFVALVTSWTYAADGRIEINQAAVEAAGGFPFTISAPGNYVLTSDLVVATDVGAITIDALSDITIDLNGFHIKGAASCTPSSCGQGSANGLMGPGFFGFGSNISVRGGSVSNFSGSCVLLGLSSRVADMHVSQCGRNGIWLGKFGNATNNLVNSSGENGVLLDDGSVYAHNSVSLSNLGAIGSGRAIQGGTATAGNYCDDGSCTANGRKRYYLTTTQFNGSEAANPGNCGPGFHFASLWEIFDPTLLVYDTARGETRDDQGSGPPAGASGWIRTGYSSQTNPAEPGKANCDSWATADFTRFGTMVRLGINTLPPNPNLWDEPGQSSIFPWIGLTERCDRAPKIWCVED